MAEWKKTVLNKIRPKSSEEKKIRALTDRAVAVTRKIALGLEVVVVGSIAKGTWLTGTNDIDIFVKFPFDTPREILERRGLDIGKKVMKELRADWEIDYAEHPYVSGRKNGYWIEIVPCYNLSDTKDIKSAVDRSPFHLQYVLEKIKPEQRDEVRLLKAFCHAHGIYGADNKTEGFSGYLCELLILKYGKFEMLVKEASKWNIGVKIELDIQSKIKFENHALVFIDPVDPNRNVAAAVSVESFARFVSAAKEFERKPDSKLFFAKTLRLIRHPEYKKLLKQRGTAVFMLVFKKPDVIEDTLYPQLRKFTERLWGMVKKESFNVIRIDFAVDPKDVFVLIEVESSKLPKIQRREGPDVFAQKNSDQFRQKYANARCLYVHNGKWVAESDRRHTDIEDFLETVLPKNKTKLEGVGIPSHIAVSMSKKRAIVDQDGIKRLIRNRVVARFLHDYFHKKL